MLLHLPLFPVSIVRVFSCSDKCVQAGFTYCDCAVIKRRIDMNAIYAMLVMLGLRISMQLRTFLFIVIPGSSADSTFFQMIQFSKSFSSESTFLGILVLPLDQPITSLLVSDHVTDHAVLAHGVVVGEHGHDAGARVLVVLHHLRMLVCFSEKRTRSRLHHHSTARSRLLHRLVLKSRSFSF